MNLKLPKKFRKFLGYQRQPEIFTSLSELLPPKIHTAPDFFPQAARGKTPRN
jgi:hypothetical protein